MLVNKIALISARILDLPHAVDYLSKRNEAGNALKEVDRLVNATNLVLSELSSFDIYVIKEQRIKVVDGKILFSSLLKMPIKVLELLDDKGESIPFTVYPTYIKCEQNASSIKYAYNTSIEIGEDFLLSDYRISEKIIAMGVVAEYLIIINDFETAVYWHERYIKALKKLVSPKSTRLKDRSFV